jgi:alkaline phosphatase
MTRTLKRTVLQTTVFLLILCLSMCSSTADKKAKNIIFLVPDGMGISNVTAARVFKYGVGEKRFPFEKLEHIGYQATYSADSMVTDSAAASSAWACGEKFKNGEISLHAESNASPKTILELSRDLGKSTGLVATSTITHATPAAFGAHVNSRNCENEIARQYIEKTGMDVLLGAGPGMFESKVAEADPCGTYGDFIKSAKEKGYKVVYNRAEMLASGNAKKLLGLFGTLSMTPGLRRTEALKQKEPSLAEMTKMALGILDKNPKGFFLMVEGSQIDWANHSNHLEYQTGEILEFDLAVKEVLDWVEADKTRRENTLIIIVPDHDCAGFAIKGPVDKILDQPGSYIEEGWISHNHTGEDTIIWSQGPYSRHLGQAIDNTDIFHIMKAAVYGEEYKNIH